MQVLLALAYFRGGQKADASDMCAQLLKRYAYCFDANRIMVDLLPSTAGVAESTQVYRMRVGELDPYATFTKGSVFQSAEVADAAINLERLEYKEEEARAGQEWNPSAWQRCRCSLCPSACRRTHLLLDEPDWLKSGGFSDSQSNLCHISNSQFTEHGLNQVMRFQIFFVMQAGENPTPPKNPLHSLMKNLPAVISRQLNFLIGSRDKSHPIQRNPPHLSLNLHNQ